MKDKYGSNIKLILLGNKKDRENEREISYEEGKNFADSNKYYFMEISCKENKNIDKAFNTIIEATYNEIIKKEIIDSDDKIILRTKKLQKDKKKCC